MAVGDRQCKQRREGMCGWPWMSVVCVSMYEFVFVLGGDSGGLWSGMV